MRARERDREREREREGERERESVCVCGCAVTVFVYVCAYILYQELATATPPPERNTHARRLTFRDVLGMCSDTIVR